MKGGKDKTFRMTEDNIQRNIAWLTRQMEMGKAEGREALPDVLRAIEHLRGLLRDTPPQPDTAASVVAEFMCKVLDRLRWELWRYYQAAADAQLDYLAERLSFGCCLI